MTSSLPSGHNFKAFADNFFTSLPLLDVLKERAIWFARTIRINRMNNCPLLCEKVGVEDLITVLTHIQSPLQFGGMFGYISIIINRN